MSDYRRREFLKASAALAVASAAILIAFGPQIYSALGARDESLREALSYSNIVFGGSVTLWLLGSLTGILRGMGDMKSAARITVWRAVAALPLFFVLIFGWGPIPSLGIVGAAIAMLTYYMLGVIDLIQHPLGLAQAGTVDPGQMPERLF